MTAAEITAGTIVLHVYGIPMPKGSHTAIVRNNRAVLLDGRRGPAREASKSWREAVEQSARDWQRDHGGVPLLDVPVQLDLTFWLPKPKSAPKSRVWPDRKPDVDKLCRHAIDSLVGTILTDDARVCELTARKRYATDCAPGAKIVIEALQ